MNAYRKPIISVAVVLSALAVLLAACSGSDMETSGDAANVGADGDQELEGEQTAGGASDQFGGETDAAEPSAPLTVGAPLGRKVIHRAHLTLEVDQPAQVVDQITTLAERAGGFVAGADLRRTGSDDELRGTITLRVPTGRLSNTIQELKDLAVRVPHQQLDTQDVTEEHADVTAQLRNLRALETELVALLSEIRQASNSADEILLVFERIRQVRDEIERLEGRLEVLDDLVALATIEVTIEPTPAAVAVAEDGWRPGDTLAAAARTTVAALQTIAEGAIWIGVTALPIALVALLPVALVYRGARRWRRAADTTGS